MLLFKPEHVEPIINGTKTQTRRIWKKVRVKIGSWHLAKIKMLDTHFFAVLEITGVRQEPLNDITEEDARKEGYANRDEYLVTFYDINKINRSDRRVDDNPVVWVVDFKTVNRKRNGE